MHSQYSPVGHGERVASTPESGDARARVAQEHFALPGSPPDSLFDVDSRLYGSSRNALFFVDSRFRGNDRSGHSARSNAPEAPCSTARIDPLAMAGFRGNDGKWRPAWPRSFPRKRESTRGCTVRVGSGRPTSVKRSCPVASLLFFSVAFVLGGCGGGPANVLDPPSFITGARPAPGAATYEPVTGDTDAGEYAFPWDLYEDGPECRVPDPPTSCPPVRIGIEDTPVAFTHPAFHGRVVLDGATFAYWRPLASQATQRAFAACTEAEPCRVFYIDSGGDPALREDRARAVLEHRGLPEGDSRWFLYDRAQGARGWYELPGVEDYSHGTQVALAALGGSFHPFPFPDPVIVPMARNFDPLEQGEDRHYFSDLVAEMRRDPEGLEELDRRYRDTLRGQHDAADIINGSYGIGVDINSVRGRNLLRTWREDHELLRDQSPLTWAEYVQRDTPEAGRTLRVWAAGNEREGGVPPSVALDEPYGEFPNVLTGDGYRNLNALGPFYFPELRGQHIAVTALSPDEERLAPYANACGELPDDWDASRFGRHYCLASPTAISEDLLGTSFAAPFVSGVLARMKARFPGVTPRELVRKLMHTADEYGDRGPYVFEGRTYEGHGFDGDIYVAEISDVDLDDPKIVIDDVTIPLGEVSFVRDPEISGWVVVQRGCTSSPGGYLVSTSGETDLCVVWGEPDGTREDAEAATERRFAYLYGAGRVDVDAEDPDEDPARAGAFAPVSTPRIALQEGGRSAPVASTRLRAPAAYGALGERLSGLSAVGFDAIDFPYRYSLSDLVSETTEPDPAIPEFLTDAAGVASACHPLIRLAPGLGCWPWAADASMHALVSPDGTGAAWRFSEGVALSAFTRHRGRLDGAASGAFSFEGGSSLAALRLDRTWPLDETGRWRMGGTFTLAADLPRGFGARRASMFEAGPALLSDWSFRVTHAWRDAHTHLSLSQPPRAETGYGRFVLPSGRLEDGTRLYETHRFSLVPSRRELTLRLAHQRPFLGGDVVLSALRTANPGHARASSRHLAGLAWRLSF